METDLFGNPLPPQETQFESNLRQYDSDTFSERLSRIHYVNSIQPQHVGFLADYPIFLLMLEAKTAFINGLFAATIVLAEAVIEQWLFRRLRQRCSLSNRAGMSQLLSCLRSKKLLHTYLIDRIDRLRNLRNPFTHARDFDDPFRIEQRSIATMQPPERLLEDDAKDALSLMYEVAEANV